MLSYEEFSKTNVRRFFNTSHCLHVQACTIGASSLTVGFKICEKQNNKVNFDSGVYFRLSNDELNRLARFLILRNSDKLEFPYHNGKTMAINILKDSVNIHILQKPTSYHFKLPMSESLSLTGIVLSTIARREFLDSSSMLTLLRNNY